MDKFFNPASIAVVGASQDRTGRFLIDNVKLHPTARVYPVNPKYDELLGLKCYPSVADIPEPVDLAILLVPARFTPAILEDCAKNGVRAVMIQSAGYAEVGPAGRAIQEECLAIAGRVGMRLWGPNCMGLVDVAGKQFFTFMSSHITHALMPYGGLSLVVQSGLLSAGFLADLAHRRGTAVARALSLGNKCDVDEVDVLEVLLKDQSTRAVALYLESLARGREFIDLAQTSPRPLAVLKSGTSQSGAQAALSHTASLAGDARLTKGLLQAAGVAQARDFHQLIDLGRTMALLPELRPDARFAVLTFSGGAGILSCDLLEADGFRMAELAPETIDALAELYPAWMPPRNPVDLWPAMEIHGPVRTMERAMEIVAADPGVDILLVHIFAGGMIETKDLKQLMAVIEKSPRPVVLWPLGQNESVLELHRLASAKDVLFFSELEAAASALAQAAKQSNRVHPGPRPEPSNRPLPDGLPEAAGVWDEADAKHLLRAWGVPSVDEARPANLDQAVEAAQDWGWPVVLKGLLPGQVHKTDQGLVALGLTGPDDLGREWDRLTGIMAGQGRLVLQPQLKPDYELIVGYLNDAQFGPTVMVGLGGVTAELEPDVAFELAPLDRSRALAMIDRLRSARLLNGFRGRPPLDRSALAELICRLADLGASHENIRQVDINPVAVVDGRPVALDATIIWADD